MSRRVSTTDETAAGAPSEIDADVVALLDRLNLPLSVLAPDGTVVHFSAAMSDLLGWTREEAVGSNAVSLAIAPTETATAVSAFQRVLAGERWFGSFPVHRKDGTRTMAWWLCTPFTGPEGEVAGMLCLLVGHHDD